MTTRATARVSSRAASTRTASTRTTGTRTTPRAGVRTAPRPELRLVQGVAATRSRPRPVSLLRHRRAPFVLLVVALLVGTTLGLLVLNTAIAVDSLKATQLRTANAQRVEELQRLEQKVVSGSAPAEVARAAVAAGMVPSGVAAHLVIAPDGSSVLRGTPEPAPAAAPVEGGN